MISSASLSLEIKASAIPSSNASSRPSATRDLNGSTAIVLVVVVLTKERRQKYVPTTPPTITKATAATSKTLRSAKTGLTLRGRVSSSGVTLTGSCSATPKFDSTRRTSGTNRNPWPRTVSMNFPFPARSPKTCRSSEMFLSKLFSSTIASGQTSFSSSSLRTR